MLLDVPKTGIIQLRTGKAKLKLDPFNQRIRLLDFSAQLEELMEILDNLSGNYQLGKIIYVGLREQIKPLEACGFTLEAKAPGFLRGETGYFFSKFMIPERSKSAHHLEAEKVLLRAQAYVENEYKTKYKGDYLIRNVTLDDVQELAKLYARIFETYPTPMNQPNYIRKVIENNLIFKVATYAGRIVSAASAEIDPENLNAEITDCATLADHRGKGLMEVLIRELEIELRKRNYLTAYTIARSVSMGMNIVFAKRGYNYGGRLINNCHICGQFEDMNIWIKQLTV